MTGHNIYSNCRIATMQSDASRGKAGYGLIASGAIVTLSGEVVWVGNVEDLPAKFASKHKINLEGRLVTPALIDCHTHLVFGGNRAREFESRLAGVSYEDISKAGGGIKSTVSATRKASFDDLVSGSLTRLDDLLSEGVAIVEIKSGYGLTIEHELRMLRIARHLETLRPVIIKTTWLAAHTVPLEYSGRADKYIDDVVIAGLKIAHAEGLVDAVDGFCETIGFTHTQVSRIFDAAHKLGLPIKLHAEQLSDQKGALLAAKFKGLSADHLEYLKPVDVEAFSQSDAVAVLLPGAFYTLGETQKPPIKALKQCGVDIAVATDCNPGTSPISSILTAMNMACIQFGLTPEDALIGTTRAAAKALGMSHEFGQIAPKYAANFAVWNVEHPSELSYWRGRSPLYQHIIEGRRHDI